MVSKFALLSSLLLASAALATPSSQLAARIARRRENRQSQPLNRLESAASGSSNVEYDTVRAGAFWNEGNGNFTAVTGTFTVPSPRCSGAVSAWVGIDGITCDIAILQAGVDITFEGCSASYDAWYAWHSSSDGNGDFSGITISARDKIRFTVTATSTTSGTAVVENLTTGQTGTQNPTSWRALCEENAEWIVADFGDGALMPLTDSGAMTFSSAAAFGPNRTYTPSGATIINIERNGQVLTSVSTDSDSVTITYL